VKLSTAGATLDLLRAVARSFQQFTICHRSQAGTNALGSLAATERMQARISTIEIEWCSTGPGSTMPTWTWSFVEPGRAMRVAVCVFASTRGSAFCNLRLVRFRVRIAERIHTGLRDVNIEVGLRCSGIRDEPVQMSFLRCLGGDPYIRPNERRTPPYGSLPGGGERSGTCPLNEKNFGSQVGHNPLSQLVIALRASEAGLTERRDCAHDTARSKQVSSVRDPNGPEGEPDWKPLHAIRQIYVVPLLCRIPLTVHLGLE